jgi:Ca-activated chloride channel homolog
MTITFSDQIYLWLLFVLPFFIITDLYSLKYVRKRAMRLANFEAIKRVSGAGKFTINWFILIMRVIVIFSLIFSAAGLIFWYEGISGENNFVLAIDASGSMLADDFIPNRLEAAKEAAILFVDSVNPTTKIGVVSFSGIGEIDNGLTINKFDTKQAINSIQFKTIHGTAIGDAIKVSSNLLVTDEKPKVIILLTDGRENVASESDLLKVVEIAKKNRITIHTIGIGTETGGQVPGISLLSTIDEETLKNIASFTNGNYFRTESKEQLKESYNKIAATTISNIPLPLRLPLLLLALFILFIEWGFLNTKFRSIP